MVVLQTTASRLSRRIASVAHAQHRRYKGLGYRPSVDYKIHRPRIGPKMALVCSASSEDKEGKGSSSEGVVAKEGDVVTVHWACMNEQGEVLESSRTSDEPTTFQVGAGDIVGNQLFEAFDGAVRGLSVGETIGIKVRVAPYHERLLYEEARLMDMVLFWMMQADGGEWKEDLLFKVPMDHPEIQRMANRYKRYDAFGAQWL